MHGAFQKLKPPGNGLVNVVVQCVYKWLILFDLHKSFVPSSRILEYKTSQRVYEYSLSS